MNRPRPQVQLPESEDLSSNDSVSHPPINPAGSQIQPIIRRARSSRNVAASSTTLRGSSARAAASSSTLGGVVVTVTTESAGTSAPSSLRSRSTHARNGASTRVLGTRQRQALGGFVWDTPEWTGICDSACATALVGILQLAEAHPQGYMGSIGNTGHGAWFAANSDVLFQDNGPLGAFTPIRHQMLQRHFGVAQHQARTYYTQQHSSEQSGTGKEEIPAWA